MKWFQAGSGVDHPWFLFRKSGQVRRMLIWAIHLHALWMCSQHPSFLLSEYSAVRIACRKPGVPPSSRVSQCYQRICIRPRDLHWSPFHLQVDQVLDQWYIDWSNTRTPEDPGPPKNLMRREHDCISFCKGFSVVDRVIRRWCCKIDKGNSSVFVHNLSQLVIRSSDSGYIGTCSEGSDFKCPVFIFF